MSTLFLLFAGLLFLLTLFTAISVQSLRDFSRHEMEHLCEKRGEPKLLGEILHWHESVEAVSADVQTLALAAAVALASAGSLYAGDPLLSPFRAIPAFVLILFVALLCNHWLPGPISKLNATAFLFHTWRAWYFTSRILAPLAYLSRGFDALAFRLAGRRPTLPTEETLEDEIRTIVTEGHREGLLEEDAREMIEGVIELHDVTVAEVMTPRTEMSSLHAGDSLERAAESFVEVGHSRIPVYDKTRDDIVGILYSKDVLAQLVKLSSDRPESIASLLRPPVFVPESKPVDDLLQEFQRQRNHMAIVLDEFGGVAGLVTIEDILEEIVGEIVDEHDDEVDEVIRRLDERVSEVSARVRIDEINEQLGLSIAEDGDFETIGGFVFAELGHVPEPGEQLQWKNLRITVLDVQGRRIERLRIEVLDETPSEPVQG